MNRVQRARAAAGVATREHAVVHRVAALLLEYPHEHQREWLPQIEAALDELPGPLREPLAATAQFLASQDPAELSQRYVETFDLQRKCSLYVTYFAYGDTRKRGVALVQFKQAYEKAGMLARDDELPDFLPIVLEFAATGDQQVGFELLLAHRAGLEVLRRALRDMGSPWAGAVEAVCLTLPPLQGTEQEVIDRLIMEGPPEEEVGLEPFTAAGDPAMTTGARR